jgi:hypothetical protein
MSIPTMNGKIKVSPVARRSDVVDDVAIVGAILT